MTIDAEIIKHSVTRDDMNKSPQDVGVFNISIFDPIAQVSGLPMVPPPYWSPVRDDILRSTIHFESMWASAIHKAITRRGARGWKLTDDKNSDRKVKQARDLLQNADAGRGWGTFISKHLNDFLLTDNGAFVEIVKKSRQASSQVLGLVHLDSRRCRRTGDPDLPVLYRDRMGREHFLRDDQVFMLSDMPNASETHYGVGFSAASRAFRTIYKLSAIELYVAEKVGGSRALAIHLLYGISKTQLETALRSAEESQRAQNRSLYKGAIMIPLPTDTPGNLVTVPLAEIPDGFDAEKERENAYLIYANAIGIPAQDIKPLSGQGLGSPKQSEILEDSADDQGLALWDKSFAYLLGAYVLPRSTNFIWSSNDLRNQNARATIANLRAKTRQIQTTTGEITSAQASTMAAEDGDIPPGLVPMDMSQSGTIYDDQKVPVSELAQDNQDARIEQGEIDPLTLPDPSSAPVAPFDVRSLFPPIPASYLSMSGGGQ